VKKLIDSLKLESKSQSTQKVKKLINGKSFHDQLLSVKDYKSLIEMTTKLQEQNMKLTDQMALLEETKLKLSGFAKEKLVKSLMKNPDLKKFVRIKILNIDRKLNTRLSYLLTSSALSHNTRIY